MRFNSIFCLIDDLKRYCPAQEVGLFLFIKAFINPRFYPVLIIRLSSFFYHLFFLTKPLAYLLQWLNVFLFGIECSPKCKIGPGLLLPHTVGTVIGAYEIGRNATIFQGVTLGARVVTFGFDANDRPTVGDNVVIGSGAKILGGVVIASNVKIKANSLVLEDLVN